MVSTQKRAQNELTSVLPRPYPRVQRPERVAPPRCGPWRGPLEATSRITFGGESREQESKVRWRDGENAGVLTLGLMEAPLEAPGAVRTWLVERARRRGDGRADGDTNRASGPGRPTAIVIAFVAVAVGVGRCVGVVVVGCCCRLTSTSSRRCTICFPGSARNPVRLVWRQNSSRPT